MKITTYPLSGYFDKDPDGAGAGAADRGDKVDDAAGAAKDAPGVGAAAAAELEKEEKDAVPGAGAAAGAADEEGKDAGKKAPITIPKARFDEVIAKGKEREAELRAEIERLTRTSAADATAENIQAVEKVIGELEAKHKQALDDGKSEEATAVLREIRIRERQIASMQSENLSERARALAVEQVKVDLLVSRLEEQFPQINPESDEYDQETVDEVLFLRQSFEARGLPSSEALSRAMKYVFAAAPAAPAAKGEEKKGLSGAASGDRKGKAVEKAVDAASRQPPSTATAGMDSDKAGGGIVGNVSQMSEEEFAALPASTKARLRGDFV